MIKKDDYALVLDYLSNGYPMEGNMRPVVQAIGLTHLALLELAPTRGAQIEVNRLTLDSKYIDVAYSTNSTFGQLKALLDIKGNWQFFKIENNQEKFLCLLNGLSTDWIIINLFNSCRIFRI